MNSLEQVFAVQWLLICHLRNYPDVQRDDIYAYLQRTAEKGLELTCLKQ